MDYIKENKKIKNIKKSNMNESKYLSLIENIDGSIWSVDLNYCLITCNSVFISTFKKAYGRKPEAGDLVIQNSLSKEIFNIWKGYYDRALSGEKFSVEVGSKLHFRNINEYMEYHFNPIFEEGCITGVTVFGRDISEKHRYLNQIKFINSITEEVNKEDIYNIKLKIISDGIVKMFNAFTSVIWLADNRISDLQGCSTGINSKEIDSDDRDFVLYPSVVSGDNEFIKELRKLSFCHIIEAGIYDDNTDSGFLFNSADTVSELLTSDIVSRYSIKSIAGYKLNIKMKNIIGFISVYSRDDILSEDIELLKTIAEIVSNTVRNNESMNSLIESGNQFRQIYENISIGVAKISMNFRIQNANEAYCKMLGYHEDEIIGMHLKDITSVEIVDENLKKQRDLSRGIIDHYRMEKIFTTKNGKEVYGILDANLIRDAEGNPSHFIGTVMDITESKRLEKQLFLDEKMKAIGHLAGGIAHDFNNILSAVIGYADLSIYELTENNPVYDNIIQIKKAGDRAKNLVKQILLFSRGDNNVKKNIYLISVVEEVIKLLKASIPSSVEINLIHDKIFSCIFSDSTKIHEIIMNLCTNASFSLKGKGIISITISEKYFENSIEGETGTSSSGLYNVLSVKDNGMGMPAELKEHIFEPFFTTKDSGSGTGMGLAVVFGILKEHHGNIQVFSEPGTGSEFIVYLPAVIEDCNETENFLLEIKGGSERILCIDDEEILGKLLKKMLEKLGYHVTVFTDSNLAFNEFVENSSKYDIIITDQTMPLLTGFELAKKVLSINQNFPIILCTGYSTSVNKEKALQAGIQGFLDKPLYQKDLALKIREIMDSISLKQ